MSDRIKNGLFEILNDQMIPNLYRCDKASMIALFIRKAMKINLNHYLLPTSLELETTLVQSFQRALLVEICFLIDVTDSETLSISRMSSIIQAVSQAMNENIHFGVISYGERGKNKEFCQMTSDSNKIIDSLQSILETNGDDQMSYSFEQALEMFTKKVKFQPHVN